MKPLSLYHPALYWLRVWQKRLFRQLAWRFSRKQYAVSVNAVSRLPFRYLKHTSKLIRTLGNSDLALQHNKVINLKLAVASMDGVIIGPGEYFSFCRLVGRPTRKRGYVEGMELSFGEARIGSGAAIFYNYIDLVLHNPTDRHFQLKLNVAEQQLEGELLCDQVREFRYHAY
jgi:vancomycin resistance protein VanW